MTYSIAIAAGAVAVLAVLILALRSKSKTIKTLKADCLAKDQKIVELNALIIDVRQTIKEVIDVQDEIRNVKTGAEESRPQVRQMPSAGDVESRLNRFNSL